MVGIRPADGFPEESGETAVTQKGEVQIRQVAKAFGISESCLQQR